MLLAGAPAIAAETGTQQRLDAIERAIDAERETQERLAHEAEALARELAELQRKSLAMAATLQENEEHLTRLEDELKRLDAEAEAKGTALVRRRAEIARLVSGLARLARQPPEAVLALPDSPADMVRTARLLGAATPEVERQAAALARDLDMLGKARAAAEAKRSRVAEAKLQLAADQTALSALLAHRASLQQETMAARERAAARIAHLSREAKDIRELIERLNAERAAREAAAREAAKRAAERAAAERAAREAEAARARSSEPGRELRRFSEAKGQIVPPVRGRITQTFGQPRGTGQPHRGLTFETRPGAQIVASFDGQIAFAGPFRAYGLILIIEHSEGYHTLIAGLGRIDCAVGQGVAAGEPVGVAASPETGSPSIYVELRRNSQPIDPLPWLASRNEKVSG